MSASSVRRGYPLKMTASPPTTAKSTLSVARAANNFSNREVVSLGFDASSMRVFFDKSRQIFQMCKPLGHGWRSPNHFANRLLHGFNLYFHREKLNAEQGRPSTPSL